MRAVHQLELDDGAGGDLSLAEGLAVARQQGAVAFERRILATRH
jgi:hypothetical protein